MTTETVTICIPSIPPRLRYLQRAIASVQMQTRPVAGLSIAYDLNHDGAWATRNRAIFAAGDSKWVGFLDDDDELLPHHVDFLVSLADAEQADVVWGWFTVIGGRDPFPHYQGRQYDPAQPHVVPITYLVKRDLLLSAVADTRGGFQPDEIGAWDTQDQPLMDAYARLGGKLVASPEVTWRWHHHGRNTSGLPTRW